MSAAPRGAGAGPDPDGPADAVRAESSQPGASAGALAGPPADPVPRRWPRPVRAAVFLLSVVVVVALLRSLVVQTFVIPSGSMEDTLIAGDRVAVTMYDADDLERGDVVVFRDPGGWLSVTEPTGARAAVQDVLVALRILPQDPGHHLIKRVIGMPGDHVVADGEGGLWVNGTAVVEPYLKPGRSASLMAFDVVVPQGCLWVMGDNRSSSADSRYHLSAPGAGCVPSSEVIGVARAVVWPLGRWSGLGEGAEAFAEVPEPAQSPRPAPPVDTAPPGAPATLAGPTAPPPPRRAGSA